MKYEEAFKTNLSEAVELVQRVREVCNNCGKAMSKIINEREHRNGQFIVTGLNFTRMNYEAIAGIQDSIKSGYLAQSIVLLRWHLELAHLFCTLWNDRETYKCWLQGKLIRPKEIGKFFEEKGLATWESTYKDWSNVIHGNAKYVEYCFNISKQAPINDNQVILAGNALRNLMFNGHKINCVSMNLLKDMLGVSDYNLMAEPYISVEQDILTYSKQQDKKERDMLGGNGDAT